MYKKTILGHPGDDPGLHRTDPVFHIFALLQVVRRPLRFQGGQLPLGTVLGDLLHALRPIRPLLFIQLPVEHGLEQPVYRQIRIPPDGGGKVAIVSYGQTKMPQAFRRIPGLAQGAQGHPADHRLLLGALAGQQHLLQCGGPQVIQALDAIAQGVQKGVELLQLLFVRGLVDPVQEGNPHLPGVVCHGFVGQQHKFLDHLVGYAPFIQLHIHRMAFFVQYQLGFRQIEVHASPFEPPVSKLFHQGPHVGEHGPDVLILFQQGFVPVEHGVYVLVGHPVAGADHRLRQPVAYHLARRVQLHDAGQGQFLRIGVEGADPIADLLGQHGQHPVREIHAGAPLIRLLIQGRLGGNIMAHVRDMHPQ